MQALGSCPLPAPYSMPAATHGCQPEWPCESRAALCPVLPAQSFLLSTPGPYSCSQPHLPAGVGEQSCGTASTGLPSARCSPFPAVPLSLPARATHSSSVAQPAASSCPLPLLPAPYSLPAVSNLNVHPNTLSTAAAPALLPACSLSAPNAPCPSLPAPCPFPNFSLPISHLLYGCSRPAAPCPPFPAHSLPAPSSLPTPAPCPPFPAHPCPLLAPCPPGIPGCQASLGQQQDRSCSLLGVLGAPRSRFAVQS